MEEEISIKRIISKGIVMAITVKIQENKVYETIFQLMSPSLSKHEPILIISSVIQLWFKQKRVKNQYFS